MAIDQQVRDIPFETIDGEQKTLADFGDKTLLVVSIPASDNEIGGTWGQNALQRLQNAVGRVQSSWRPASADEGFEIVRRRLFEPLSNEQAVARDARRLSRPPSFGSCDSRGAEITKSKVGTELNSLITPTCWKNAQGRTNAKSGRRAKARFGRGTGSGNS
jgi:hypothetical protein